MRGRKPTPKDIHELGGRDHNKKKEPAYLDEMDRQQLDDEVFTGMPPGVAKRARAMLALLCSRFVLSSCDAESFARYCQHLRLAYQADEILRRDGVVTIDEQGLPRKHPCLQIHRDNSLAALRYEEQFGLTPSSRARLAKPEQIAEDREVSDFADFLEDK